MRCHIPECENPSDPDGGVLCVTHQQWTASRMRRCLDAIQVAIMDEDGLDGLVGERLLRELRPLANRSNVPR